MDQLTSKNKKSIVRDCSSSDCWDNQDESALICVLCKRKVHYECSELPAYEIQRIISSTSNSYKCVSCVRVPKSLIKIVNQHKYKKVCKEIAEKDKVIERLQEELRLKTNARNIIRIDLQSFLSDKIKDIEAKTRDVIKEELRSTAKATSYKNSTKQTYAEIIKEKSKEIKDIVKEQHEEDKREERDIESRKNNIIMHGVREDQNETEEEQREGDNNEVTELLTNVFGDQKHKDFKAVCERIGKKGEKYRPLKVTFFNEQQKKRLMSNLYKLKINAPSYKVSVTEDYTRKERMKIKEEYTKAKKLNEENTGKGEFIWRVKGCPRTSLYLKKIPRTTVEQASTKTKNNKIYREIPVQRILQIRCSVLIFASFSYFVSTKVSPHKQIKNVAFFYSNYLRH